MLKLLANPFLVYPLSFILILLIYLLGWSDAFPSLSPGLMVFFLVTFGISIFLGMVLQKLNVIVYQPLQKSNLPFLFFFILWAGHVMQFLIVGEIPLLTLLSGIAEQSDYKEFGIKTYHVILVSFNSFLIVYFFHYFLSRKSIRSFLMYILALVPAVLIVNRGMFLIGMISSLVVFVMSQRFFIKLKHVMLGGILMLVILYFFGVVGNMRSGNNDPMYIPLKSGVSEKFVSSSIPLEYYWTYLYAASPLANFQNNINETKEVNYNFFQMFLFEFTPEIVSKRIASMFDLEPLGHHQVRKFLTVGTVYSKSYSYTKWAGPVLLFGYFVFLVLLILGLVPSSSQYHVSSVAILSTLVFMNTFSNMFVFSGILLQLFYPVLFKYVFSKRYVIKSK